MEAAHCLKKGGRLNPVQQTRSPKEGLRGGQEGLASVPHQGTGNV